MEEFGGDAAIIGAAIVFYFVFFALIMALSVLMIICRWKIFEKAGQEGWASLIPVYNIMVMMDITGRPMWWILLMFVPFANIYVAFTSGIDLAKCFGKDTGFGLGLIFLPIIFYPILAFGDAQYTQPIDRPD